MGRFKNLLYFVNILDVKEIVFYNEEDLIDLIGGEVFLG